jgi:hypothetical protein
MTGEKYNVKSSMKSGMAYIFCRTIDMTGDLSRYSMLVGIYRDSATAVLEQIPRPSAFIAPARTGRGSFMG